MSRYPQFNVNNQHQLIRRQNTYVLDRKLVTIHSEDRDINKWPQSNHFEVELPETLSNVQSLRLVEIQLPTNQYVFSNNQQNTQLQFYIILGNSFLPTEVYLALYNNINNPYTITIQEGFYSPDEMAYELENLMNQSISDYLLTDPSSVSIGATTYTNFKVRYDKVGQKMFFGNTRDNFRLPFNVKVDYSVQCNSIVTEHQSPNVWEQYTKWGLPSYLGFQKENYTTTETSGNVLFNYDTSNVWLTPDASGVVLLPGANYYAYYIASPNTISIFGDSAIYMEFDKFNTIDELKPYVERTNNTYQNDYNGRVNSAFAKIPVTANGQSSQIFDSRNGFLQNVSQYHPPIDKIKKAKFKFRYHDGRLVDFKDNNFNFTIAFNQLKDEIARDYIVRVPEEYIL
jgi:hypothetical protein